MKDWKASFYTKKGWPKCLTTSIDLVRATRVLQRLLKQTYNESISVRQSKKGISASTIQNSILLTSVLTMIEPIEEVEPILNWILIVPAFVVFKSISWSQVLLYTRYWPYPVIEFLDTPVSIIILQNSFELYQVIVIYIKGSCSVLLLVES